MSDTTGKTRASLQPSDRGEITAWPAHVERAKELGFPFDDESIGRWLYDNAEEKWWKFLHHFENTTPYQHIEHYWIEGMGLYGADLRDDVSVGAFIPGTDAPYAVFKSFRADSAKEARDVVYAAMRLYLHEHTLLAQRDALVAALREISPDNTEFVDDHPIEGSWRNMEEALEGMRAYIRAKYPQVAAILDGDLPEATP